MRIHIRLGRDANGEITTFDLPPPQEAGISAASWEGASVSTALQYLQRVLDPGLGYVLSCRRGLCNICAAKIDGKVQTACTTPLHDGILIEPARDTLILRDTVVELSLVRKARIGANGAEDVKPPGAPAVEATG
jgi:succinate dehydrogenase/fumarate reductase-like Fe-S protein